MMITMRLRGIKIIRNPVTGKVYAYHRAAGRPIKAEYGTPEFLAEVAAIEQDLRQARNPKLAGTWGWLVTEYKLTPEWADLAPRTKADYEDVFDFLARSDAMPLEVLDAAFVIGLRNRTFEKRKRRFANYVLQVISRVWNVGAAMGKVPHANPVHRDQKLRRPRNAPVVNRPWTPAELDAVLAEASRPLGVAIALGAWAAWREGDVVRLPRHVYDGDTIEARQGKTGAFVQMPVHTRLKATLDTELATLPRLKDVPLVINERGRPYTESGFRASFFKLIRRLEEEEKVGPGLTFHGLRHTVATAIADAGGDTRDIMAVTGHATESQVKRYTERADKRRRSARAIALLEAPKPEKD